MQGQIGNPAPAGFPSSDFELEWEELPEEVRKEIKDEIIEGIHETIPLDIIVQRAFEENIESIIEQGEKDQILEIVFEGVDAETIARNIPPEVVEEVEQDRMGASPGETASDPERAKAMQEALFSPLLRIVTIVGGAFSALLAAVFFVTGGYPLAIVLLLTLMFFGYSYTLDLDRI